MPVARRQMRKPAAGDVFTYPFLWKRQQIQGETEGRKPRPVCMAVTAANADGNTLLFIVPITTQPPMDGRIAIEVPEIEAKRAGLDTEKPCWVMLDEFNSDVFERSFVFEDRTPLGAFSSKFTARLQGTLLAAAKDGKARIVNRQD